jgi:heme exporter protein D
LGNGHVATGGVGAGVGALVVALVVAVVVDVVMLVLVVPELVQLRALLPDVLDEHIQVGQTHAPPSVTHRFRKWHVVVL